ncbi:MAG: DUF1360 domain-containing protein [Solirubrobacteraceae bacterium]
MADEDGAAATAERSAEQEGELGAIAAGYAPGEERPLGGYVALVGVYGGATAAALIALRRAGRPLPERISAADVALIGIASHKLSRTITKDKVTSFLRAPFTRFQEPSGQGEVDEEPRGHGLQLAVGELLVCPYCVAQWVATGLTLSLVAAPRPTRLFSTVFVAHTLSDFLQAAYRAMEAQA